MVTWECDRTKLEAAKAAADKEVNEMMDLSAMFLRDYREDKVKDIDHDILAKTASIMAGWVIILGTSQKHAMKAIAEMMPLVEELNHAEAPATEKL